jgi:uncharacterized repeat protein (TIGR03803 family)
MEIYGVWLFRFYKSFHRLSRRFRPLAAVLLVASVFAAISQSDAAAPSYKLIASFRSSAIGVPQGATLLGSDGFIYFTATTGAGTQIARILPSGKGANVIFTSPSGGDVQLQSLVEGTDGFLYAASSSGGAFESGYIFKIHKDGTGFQAVYSLQGGDGDTPTGVFIGHDGNLYGLVYNIVTADEDHEGDGFFKVSTSGSDYQAFILPNGVARVSLVQGKGADNNFYGVEGSNNSVFSVAPDGTNYAVLHTFTGQDGSDVSAALVQGTDSALYGVTSSGGVGAGTIFKVSTDGNTFSVLQTFIGTNGETPQTALTVGPDGFMYGTALLGGKDEGEDEGIVFRVSTDGSDYEIVHAFTEEIPDSTMVVDGGLLFGLTEDSILFSIDPFGTGSGGGTSGSTSGEAGSFQGLLGDGSGWLSISLTKNGTFTGTLITGDTTHHLKGKFTNGEFTGSVNGIPVTFSLSGTGSQTLLSGSANGVALDAGHSAYVPKTSVGEAGRYTVLLSSTGADPTIPPGMGYAAIDIGKTGSVTIIGALPDGEKFSTSALLLGGTGGDQFVFYKNLAYPSVATKGDKGVIRGSFDFATDSPPSITGSVSWQKPSQTKGVYPAVINTSFAVAASPYLYSKSTGVLPGFLSGTLLLTDDSTLGLTGTQRAATLTEPKTFVVQNTDPRKWKLKIDTTTGALTGSFYYPGATRSTPFSGALLQSGTSGGGYFLGPGRGGSVILGQ